MECVRVAGAVFVALASSAAVGAQPRPAPPPPLPLTQLDERAPAADLDNRTFTLTFAQPVPVRDLLILLVRGTSLSLVPDPGLGGSFIGELKNVTVRQALTLILQPLGYEYAVDGTVVRVFRREPETRLFDINYIATVRASESLVAAAGAGRTTAGVTASTRTDVFGDLTEALKTMLSDKGTFTIDRTAGLLQVTDAADRLERVSTFLDAMHERVHRQIQVDAQVVEVELNDEHATGVDWRLVSSQLRGATSAAAGSARALTGLRVTDVARLFDLLAAQGQTTILASPSLLALNNEPAIVTTDAMALSVTPQAGGDGAIMLDVTPIVRAPAVQEAELLARVADGETLVIAGFTRDREVRERKNIGTTGGWFGRGTVVTRKKVELVILLTPRVLVGASAQ